jgi:hypothetical protein
MFQRTLYSSRCAGHPQAAHQVVSAERLIQDALPRAATVQTVASQTSPPVTDCLEPIPVGDPRNTTEGSDFMSSTGTARMDGNNRNIALSFIGAF